MKPTHALTTTPQHTTRPLSGTERGWLVANNISPPFSNQVIVALDGHIDFDQLKDAVQRAAHANPMMRARWTGHGPWSRWKTDGPTPEVRKISLPDWDGNSHKGYQPIQNTPIHPRDGHVARLWYVESDNPQRNHLVFQFSHAAADGRGSLIAMREIARAARNEPLQGTTLSTGDCTFARTLSKHIPPDPNPKQQSASPFGPLQHHNLSWPPIWSHRRFPLQPKSILARILVSLHNNAHIAPSGHMRVGVPVDLRRHDPNLHTLDNLTGILSFSLRDAIQGPNIAHTVSQLFQTRLDAFEHLANPVSNNALRWFPIRWAEALGRKQAQKELQNERFPTGTMLSNLGKFTPADFDFPNARCTHMFMPAPGHVSLPLWITTSGDGTHLSLCLVTTASFATPERLENLMDAMQRDLQNPDLLEHAAVGA